MIVAVADPKDLASLRLASRLWCDLSSKRFGSARLRHLRCVYSPYSFQSLVDLTAHPIFGLCIQSFVIGTYRMRKHLVNTQPHKEASPANVAALIQFRFQQSELPIALLAKALENLNRHDVVPRIGLYEDVICDASGKACYRYGFGYNKLYGSVSLARYGRSLVAKTLHDLITVGRGSGCLISGISIDLQWNSSEPRVIDRHMGLYHLIQELVLYDADESLALHDTDGHVPRWDMAVKLTDPCEVEPHVVQVCNQGRCLRLRSISIESFQVTDLPQLESASFGALASAVAAEYQLQRIALEHCFVDGSIFEMLWQNSRTLRHMSISNTTLYVDSIEDGIELLDIFKTGLSLETLSLCMLSYERKSRILVVDEKVESRGSDAIANMVDELVKTVEQLNTTMEPNEINDNEAVHCCIS